MVFSNMKDNLPSELLKKLLATHDDKQRKTKMSNDGFFLYALFNLAALAEAGNDRRTRVI